jgi:hypothetical protein
MYMTTLWKKNFKDACVLKLNIIQSHNSVLWDWQYFTEYSPYSLWLWRTFLENDSIMQNIFHIQFECEKYSIKYCQFRKTLLWLWLMLWSRSKMHSSIMSPTFKKLLIYISRVLRLVSTDHDKERKKENKIKMLLDWKLWPPPTQNLVRQLPKRQSRQQVSKW